MRVNKESQGFVQALLSSVFKIANVIEVMRLVMLFNIVQQWVALLHHPENGALILPVLPQEEVDLSDFAEAYATYRSRYATGFFFARVCAWCMLC